MPDQPEPTVQATRYEVSLLPEGHDGRRYFTITVEYRGAARWAVLDAPFCLGADGDWDHEPQSTSRTDDWLDAHRFDLDTALRLAKAAAPHIVVNGRTATDAWHRTQNPA